MICLLLLTLGRLHSSSDSAMALSLPVPLLAISVQWLELIRRNSHTNVQINLWDVSSIVVRIFHCKKPQTNRVESRQSYVKLEIRGDCSDVTSSFPCFQKFGMSSETLRFLDFKCDFLANKTSDQKNIFRVSN